MKEATSKQQPDLAKDLRTRGCAVCNHVIKSARDFLAHWQYALASDQKAQSEFAGELGFCPLHLWQLHEMSSPWGESVGLARLVEHISELLERIEPRPIEEIIRTSRTCRVCCMLQTVEAAYLTRLCDFLSDPSGREIYKSSQGVCLRHLAKLLSISQQPVPTFLRTTTASRLRQLAAQMHSYAGKREATRRDLVKKEEEDASLRAVIRLAGEKHYSAP